MKTPTFDLEPPKIDSANNTREEDGIVSYVTNRYTAMKTARFAADKEWTNYQLQMDAIWMPYPDGRSSFALPLTRALVERGIAEEIRIPVMRQVRAERQDYQAQATAYEEVRKYVGRVGNYDWNLLRNAYTCWTY